MKPRLGGCVGNSEAFDWHKKIWPARFLLFGEYCVLEDGGEALGCPFTGFSLRVNERFSSVCRESDANVNKLWQFLQGRFGEGRSLSLDIVSNIPRGYGLGSSAALCLAVLELFEKQVLGYAVGEPERFLLLQGLEGCFHGRSSGIDPMMVAAKGLLWVKRGGNVFSRWRPVEAKSDVDIVLLDGGVRRVPNETWVPRVLARLRKQPRGKRSWAEYKRMSRLGAEALIAGDLNALAVSLRMIMNIQMSVGVLTSKADRWLGPDVLGVKAMGAGGGGTILMVCKRNCLKARDLGCQVLWRGALDDVF